MTEVIWAVRIFQPIYRELRGGPGGATPWAWAAAQEALFGARETPQRGLSSKRLGIEHNASRLSPTAWRRPRKVRENLRRLNFIYIL